MPRQFFPTHAAADVPSKLQQRPPCSQRTRERIEYPHGHRRIFFRQTDKVICAEKAEREQDGDDTILTVCNDPMQYRFPIRTSGQGSAGQFPGTKMGIDVPCGNIRAVKTFSVWAKVTQRKYMDVVFRRQSRGQIGAGIRQQGDFFGGITHLKICFSFCQPFS